MNRSCEAWLEHEHIMAARLVREAVQEIQCATLVWRSNEPPALR